MALTTRKDILDQMEYLFNQIPSLVTVTRQRDTDVEPYDPDECPALNIKPGTAQITHNVSDDEHALPVALEMHTTSRATVAEAENLLGDIAAQIEANDTWGGYADGTNIESHGIDITQTGDIITAGTIDITVNYTTAKGKI